MSSSEKASGVSCTLSRLGGVLQRKIAEGMLGQAETTHVYFSLSPRVSCNIFHPKTSVMKTDTVAKTIDVFVFFLLDLQDVS